MSIESNLNSLWKTFPYDLGECFTLLCNRVYDRRTFNSEIATNRVQLSFFGVASELLWNDPEAARRQVSVERDKGSSGSRRLFNAITSIVSLNYRKWAHKQAAASHAHLHVAPLPRVSYLVSRRNSVSSSGAAPFSVERTQASLKIIAVESLASLKIECEDRENRCCNKWHAKFSVALCQCNEPSHHSFVQYLGSLFPQIALT